MPMGQRSFPASRPTSGHDQLAAFAMALVRASLAIVFAAAYLAARETGENGQPAL